MSGEILNSVRNILAYVEELRGFGSQLPQNKKIELLSKIDQECSNVYRRININQNDVQKPTTTNLSTVKKPLVLPKPQIVLPKQREIPASAVISQAPVPQFTSAKFRNLTKEEKKKLIFDITLNTDELEDFIKLQRAKAKGKVVKERIEKKDYTIYQPSSVGKTANKFMKKFAERFIHNYPNFFKLMFGHFRMVEMEILSRSYVSMILFFTLISFPGIFLFFLALNFAFHLNILIILLIAFFGMIITFVGHYFYPASLISGKSKKIKLEYPFALVHMSAVAGSGANPISIFELIADSDDYVELRKEVKKIMNYVNLFGYNLTNAMRNVAATTPSSDLKELLNGMISTIETGGDLKGYLKEKAEDALNTYKLDRKKQVEALATYSEIYTAILIASPLLLLVTLAIINSIGGGFGGLSVVTIAWIGILGALPLLNVGFMFFITSSQKGL